MRGVPAVGAAAAASASRMSTSLFVASCMYALMIGIKINHVMKAV